jgi:hypothetical protein
LPDKPYLIQFNSTGNPNEGYISSTQFSEKLPFDIKRVFWTYNTPESIVRGRHAHIATQQVLVAVNSTLTIKTEDGLGGNELFELNNPNTGLYLPPMYWANLHFSEGAVLLSLASTDFDEADYLREYDAFKEMAQFNASNK